MKSIWSWLKIFVLHAKYQTIFLIQRVRGKELVVINDFQIKDKALQIHRPHLAFGLVSEVCFSGGLRIRQTSGLFIFNWKSLVVIVKWCQITRQFSDWAGWCVPGYREAGHWSHWGWTPHLVPLHVGWTLKLEGSNAMIEMMIRTRAIRQLI